MSGLLRFTVSALFVSTVLAGVLFVYPEGAVVLGVDFWNLPALERQVEESRHYTAELEDHGRSIFARLAGKHQVTVELLEGRLSLLEAAIRFRDLNACGRWKAVELSYYYLGRSDAERVCRQVLGWVAEDGATIDPCRAEARRAALQDELQHLLASGQPLAWPDQPAQ